MIVVDASLAAKWVLTEDDSVTAAHFLANYADRLCGPDLLMIEVAAAIVRRANEDKTFRDDATQALNKWTSRVAPLLVDIHPTTFGGLSHAGQLAFRLGHPLKDCVYLALAIELDAELATCDARFAARARTIWPRVRLLADYSPAA